MIAIEHIDLGPLVNCGVTQVDTEHLPWPGATFSQGESASAEQVDASYAALATTLGVRVENIRGVRQVHGGAVVVNPTSSNEEGDAVISGQPGVGVGVKIADCLGILIYDPEKRVVAAVHSGWRGTAQRIIVNTIGVLQQRWGSRVEDLRVAFSPSASGARYQVGADVQTLLPRSCTPDGAAENKWLFDNQHEVLQDLLSAGLNPSQVRLNPACTIQDRRYHSHRRDGATAGRCFAFIGLKNPL